MATTKKTIKKEEELAEKAHELVKEAKEKKVIKPITEIEPEEITSTGDKKVKEDVKIEAPVEEKSKKAKYEIGSIVYVSKDADADLEGFKLFPQYKKYTYTVEAYDEKSGVYTLRRLNLSLKLQESFIVSPDEHAHDQLNRMYY